MTRPRLLAQLDRGLARGLILISAPAGYGKTSLVVDWLAQRPSLTAAWVSLDENDNDPDVFLRYLTTAVHNAFAPERPCAATQSLLGAPQPPPVGSPKYRRSGSGWPTPTVSRSSRGRMIS